MQQRPWLCIIEFMTYGDLKDVLQTCKEKGFALNYVEQLHIVQQLTRGLVYLASKRYIHMDIAARNCLMGENTVCKLADFGLTQQLDEGKDTYRLRKTAKLPVRWIAIEALKTGIFDEKSDVWAFGVLIWEVLSYGKHPFAEIENAAVQGYVERGGRLGRPAGAEKDFWDAAFACWTLPKTLRPTFASLQAAFDRLEAPARRMSAPLRDIGYRLVAKSRYAIWGKDEGSCRRLTKAMRARFIDLTPAA